MKEVIANNEFKNILINSVDMLCDAVSSTLGPSGNNVLINSDDGVPFITNDGVTIARAIESSDPKVNTILEIAKEASLKTNDEVGDGTTTTLVLMQSILKEALKEADNGYNPIILKNELQNATQKVIKLLNDYKKEPSQDDLKAIASISAGDEIIGEFITNVFIKMQNKYAIKLEESPFLETFYEIKTGYNLEVDNISSLYFQNDDAIYLKNAYILLINGYLESFEQISEVINEGIERNKNIVIFADDFDDSLLREVLLYYIQEKKNIFLFKIPEYGLHKEIVKEDLAVLTNAHIKDLTFTRVNWSDLGFTNECIINKNEVVVINDNQNAKKRLNELINQLPNINEVYEKDFITSRIARLDKGTAIVYVGGVTKTEIKEKMMRFEDALCALEVAKNGILPGGGMTFLKISEELLEKSIGEKVLKKALAVPFQKIMENAGEDYLKRKQELQSQNYEKLYNLKTKVYENIKKTKVVDPLLVLSEEVKNAASIAGMLLTTNYLVINENLKISQRDNII